MAAFLLLLHFLLFTIGFGGEITISSYSGFNSFVNEVNKGNKYLGSTVLLGSDITLSQAVNPIGLNTTHYFAGVFDGQGHVISNLTVSVSSRFAGLFGYSKGLTVKNLVLDSSCSITNTFETRTTYPYTGSIIGFCRSDRGECIIKNTVNMAGVTFAGTSIDHTMYLGGIAGRLSVQRYSYTVKNCANYGSVTHSGTSNYTYIGGIAGASGKSAFGYVQNCLNYGTITHGGSTSNYLNVGGIVGNTERTSIDSCVSAGEISPYDCPKGSTCYIGSFCGRITVDTYIKNCYWSDNIAYDAYDSYRSSFTDSSSYNASSFELDEPVIIDGNTEDTLIDALNAAADYYPLRGYSHWLLNENENTVSFSMNEAKFNFLLDSQVILLPDLTDNGKKVFDGWYTDEKLVNPLTNFEVDKDTHLYSQLTENTNRYKIVFDTRGGPPLDPVTAVFGTSVKLLTNYRSEYCIIAWWEDKHGDRPNNTFDMPAYDFTLYAVWKCTHIMTAGNLNDFSKVVNSGTSYSGTTVFLGTDIDFASQEISPIGDTPNHGFNGVFDGQGYTISHLTTRASSRYAGLFGYSKKMTIRNVVVDSTCSVNNTFRSSSSTIHVGGLVGYCYTDSGQCGIENSVNMADVSFVGDTRSSLYLGGVIGTLYSLGCESYVRNCANYGSVTNYGNSKNLYMGGIAGGSQDSSYKYIQNCLNYGKITSTGNTTKTAYLGGIGGVSSVTYVEHCASAGKIVLTGKTNASFAGSIVGNVNSNVHINYCFWTSDVGADGANGTGSVQNMTGTATSPSSTRSIVSSLLSSSTNSNWSSWLNNPEGKTVTFKINNGKGFSLSSSMILLPNLADDKSRKFVGWFKDSAFANNYTAVTVTDGMTLYGHWDKYMAICYQNVIGTTTTRTKYVKYNKTYGKLEGFNRTGYTFLGWFTDATGGTEVKNTTIVTKLSDHVLYAHWLINQCTITFDSNGGSACAAITQDYGTAVTFPTPARTGYTFVYWCSDSRLATKYTGTTIPAENITLYARWIANNYTVTFDVKGGNALSSNTKVVTFGSEYGSLPTPSMESNSFIGWFTYNGEERVTSETVVSIANNHTLYAHWEEITNQVEIVFATKSLTRDEVKDILRRYTNADFTIDKYEVNEETDEINVIIIFTNKEDAKEFVDAVNESGGAEDGVKRASFVFDGKNKSISPLIYPTLLLNTMIL